MSATCPRKIMFDWRTLGLGVVVFSATFAAGWWFGLGQPAPAAAVTKAEPAASAPEPKPQQVAVLSQPAPLVKAWPRGKGLTENDGLRQAVVLRAKAYQRPVCNQDPKTLYIVAATKYAEVLMRSAGCNNFPKCPMGMGALGDVWQLNRSAADKPVAEAMAAVNAAGGLSEKDFRGDVGRAVRVIAGADFYSGPPPKCEEASSRSGTWRVRVRR